MTPPPALPCCSFCGATNRERAHFVAAPVRVYICDECIDIAALSIGRRVVPTDIGVEKVLDAIDVSVSLIDDGIAKAVAVRAELLAWRGRVAASRPPPPPAAG